MTPRRCWVLQLKTSQCSATIVALIFSEKPHPNHTPEQYIHRYIEQYIHRYIEQSIHTSTSSLRSFSPIRMLTSNSVKPLLKSLDSFHAVVYCLLFISLSWQKHFAGLTLILDPKAKAFPPSLSPSALMGATG